ncbi:GNAT family N-acetyltransferase [Ruegeria sp. HKCCC2117]|uniref:GNAT family N-acetyltransferase n=1 Tax=Ruegeria sp. HKCCC2117 TaxID=2682992 RepID=UPI0020C3A4DF|nr:GNAT family N-acetyltransferase [Ruegeria sp. HKCCC2117]
MSRDKFAAMTSLKIRQATVADVIPLSGLIRRTIRVSNFKDYDQKPIDRLCTIFEPEPVTKRIENELILLCFMGTELVGTVGLRDDYLRSMFVDPEYQGRGLGKMLVARIEEEARQRAIPEMMLHSSLTAREFYLALGYEFVEFQTYPEGPFVLMRKPLL